LMEAADPKGMRSMPESDVELNLDSFRRLNAVCSRFEAAWRQGRPPRLGDYLAEGPGPERGARLRELLLQEWAGRRQRHQEFTREEYLERFPAQQPDVEAAWLQWQRWLYPTGGAEASTPRTQPGGLAEHPGAALIRQAGYEEV